MRLALPKLLLLPSLALIWLSCDQDINSAKDQPLVDYVIVATDSSTAAPLDSVRVRITTITGDTASYITDPAEGRVQLATVASSRTLLQFNRRGYHSLDSIDTVNAPIDSIFHRPLTRLLRVRMARLGTTVSSRPQINLLLRDANLEKLKKATVVFEDSTGDLHTVSDTGATGVVGLNGLKVGTNQVLVKHPGYLGYWFEVKIETISDTARIPTQVITLLALGSNRISGQVFFATSSLPKPLLGAKVEFELKDSLAFPRTFTTFTSGKVEDQGHFLLDSVPALEGQILYYKDRTSMEHVKAVPILKEEVLQDGPLPPLTLTLVSDSSRPYLVERPKDTVGPKDSLLFRFTQRVDVVDGYQVRLINQGPLLLDTVWNKDKTLLKIAQRGANWVRGKKYEYEFMARNGNGQYFTAQGDSLNVLKGVFSVPDSAVVGDSTLLLPKNISFTSFNSGGNFRFSETDTNSSPKPDSSSQYGRLKWSWSQPSGRKVDTLLLYYKDDGHSVDNWQLWSAIPGSPDSVTLSFSEHYATSRLPGKSDLLPFKIPGGKLHFMIIPMHAGKEYPGTTLDALEQGMGPTVYSGISKGSDSLRTNEGAVDSLIVEYLQTSGEVGSVFDWGSVRPTPALYFNGVRDSVGKNLTWEWKDGKKGWIKYKLPTTLEGTTRIRADLNGVSYQGKPIWHRNRKNEFVLP